GSIYEIFVGIIPREELQSKVQCFRCSRGHEEEPPFRLQNSLDFPANRLQVGYKFQSTDGNDGVKEMVSKGDGLSRRRLEHGANTVSPQGMTDGIGHRVGIDSV